MPRLSRCSVSMLSAQEQSRGAPPMSVSWSTLAELRDFWAPLLRRRLALALSFLGFGLIAGTSGLTLVVADNESDPRSAYAFAPLERPTATSAAPNASAEVPIVETVVPRQVTEPDRVAREIAASTPEPAASASDPRLATAANAAQARAGGSPGPVTAQSEQAAPAESTPVVEASGPQSGDSVPAAVEPPTPQTAPVRPRKTARQQSGHRQAYQQPRRRYAQPFWPFW